MIGTPLGLCSVECTMLINLHRFVIATRACLIASDISVLFVTWNKTSKMKQAVFQADRRTSSLLLLVLRDGTLYFVLLLLMNIMHVALWVTNVFRYALTFIVPISSITISQFLLNLSHVKVSTSNNTMKISSLPAASHLQTSSLAYQSTFIASMGAPLSYWSYPDIGDGHKCKESEDEAIPATFDCYLDINNSEVVWDRLDVVQLSEFGLGSQEPRSH
ncbi:hypothetical protein AcW1_002913 [Taiwanofungus camphoratus]|nr:hypothetical protein AcV7_005676 [Antrodia cinnamomea]KAI0942230.1 hypothetical protein AcW1_002913 [Antrodia cinnamomea]